MGFVDLGFPLNTLRIKGRAEIHAGPALCAEFEMQGRAAYGYINHRRQRLLSVPKGARALEGYGSADAQVHARSCPIEKSAGPSRRLQRGTSLTDELPAVGA